MPVYSLGPGGITTKFRSKSKSHQKTTQEYPRQPKEKEYSTTLVPHDIASWKVALQAGMDPNSIWTEDDLKQKWLNDKYRWFDWNTPIHLTLFLEDYDSAELLLRSGADINLCNARGRTALMEAVHNHHNTTASFLINRGADLNASTIDGIFQDNLYWDMHEKVEVGTVPIYEAMRFADAHMVRSLAEGGADVNCASREGWMPLDIALLDKQCLTMDALLKHGGHFSSIASHRSNFRDEFPIMARKLFSASTHSEMFPSQDLLEVYWWIMSTPDVQEILSVRNSDISTLSRRLIKRFFKTLCEIAEVQDLQTRDRPFCSQCIEFQSWTCPTYEPRNDSHIIKYGDRATFELYPLRTLLEESARLGCPLCSIIADGIDKQEIYERRWIAQKSETELKKFDSEIVGAVSLEIARPGGSFYMLRVLMSSSLNFCLDLTYLDGKYLCSLSKHMIQHTILNTCHYNNQQTETSSPEAFKLAKYWLNTCELSHKTCKKFCSGEMSLPTRVIDVGNDTKAPFLFRSHGLKGVYCALSYCWGNSTPTMNFYKTTRANLVSHESAMPLHELPATLRDAIIVARNLGFQYIWIDAICIVQDDGDEWAHEAARMQQVYAGASFTISSVASSSSHDGLFRPRQTRNSTAVCLNYRIPKAFREYAWRAGSTRLSVPDLPMYLVACPNILPAMEPSMHGPVHDRAWTLQEQMMSTRILYYGHGTLWWECFEQYASEGQPGPLRLSDYAAWERSETKNAIRGAFTYQLADADAFKYWQQLVYDYTRRAMTERRDRLTAIVSLGHALEPFMKSKFVAGVWSGDLLLQSLCWEVRVHDESIRNPQFPTWSWASVTAFVLFDLVGHQEAYGAMRRIANVISFDPNITDEAQTAVTGSITLEGTIGKLAKPKTWNTDESYLDPYRQDCKADSIDQCWYIDVLESDMWVPVRRVRLLLQKCKGDSQIFRRIGIGLGDEEGCSEILRNVAITLI
ncbi:heterokaryon incompatibility protein domain-containing protein [Trichoderma chlorosporum]